MTKILEIISALSDDELDSISDDELIHMMDQTLIKTMQMLNQYNK